MINGEFSKYHPVTNLIYFVLFFISVFYINNPFVLFFLLIISAIHNTVADGGKRLRANALFYILIAAVIFLSNPFFVHRGAVILFYLSGNPVTLESAVFGLKSALSLVTVLVAFSAFNIIINPEKFMYLFSRAAEQTAFVVMLGMRFVPTLKRRLTEISDISKISGTYGAAKRQPAPAALMKKITGAMHMMMRLITWSLEDAVVTAQSMRSRGYGVNIKTKNGRTFYFIYKFSKRDVLFIFLNITSFTLFIFTFIRYDIDFKIYPTFADSPFGSMASYKFYINLFFLTVQTALPVFAEIINRIKWSLIYNADNRI